MSELKSVLPVSRNQSVELEISALGSDGQGIGRHLGFVVFVPFALPGERVEALVIKVTSSYAVGKLMSVIKASPCRVEPRCGAFRRCGGCQLQHMDYEAQLAFKRETVIGALRTIGGVAEPPVLPVLGMEEPWRYRNKGIFPVGRGAAGLAMGMYAPRSHTIVDMQDCPLQPEAATRVMAAVRRWAERNHVQPYDESTGAGLLRGVMARSFADTGETLAVVITKDRELPAAEDLATGLRGSVPGLTGIVQNVNPEDTNVVLGKRDRLVWGVANARARIGDLEYAVGAQSFFQVNSLQMQRLYETALEMAGLTGEETVVDAYCGVGTIGQFLASRAKAVVGIESVPQSVEEARHSAERNGISNAEYICGRAEEVFPQLAQKGLKPDVIVMDPPRKGCEERFLDAAVKTGARRLVYVSCNPATFARDVKCLAGRGYALMQVQPVDMFPQTAEVECVGWMSRIK